MDPRNASARGRAPRISKTVFILVPESGFESAIFNMARRTCRIAFQTGLIPFYPPLYYGAFVTPEEWSTGGKEMSMWWLRRSQRIWLQFPQEDAEDLDEFSYRILDENERLGERRPVYQLHQVERQGEAFRLVPRAMPREEVRELLQCNVQSGLARACV